MEKRGESDFFSPKSSLHRDKPGGGVTEKWGERTPLIPEYGSMDNLPTPDELGEKLKAGEITKEEAIEVMSQRARRDALSGLYGPPMDAEAKHADSKGMRKAGTLVFVLVILALVALYVLMQMLG